jgi:hypothetical protein
MDTIFYAPIISGKEFIDIDEKVIDVDAELSGD